MKKKLSRILGVSVTLVLLVSLGLFAAPVAADVSSASVEPDDPEISAETFYEIIFTVGEDTAADGNESITVVFPEGTDASMIDDDTGEVQLQSSAGLWAGSANALADVPNGDVTTDADLVTVTIDIRAALNDIMEGASVKLIIGDDSFVDEGVISPDDAGDYTLTVETSVEPAPIASAVYAIELPMPTELPGIISVYNPAGIYMESFTGTTAMALATARCTAPGYTVKIGPGTYDDATDGWNTNQDETTFVAIGALEDTVWIGNVTIDQALCVIDGITFKGGTVTIAAAGDEATIQDCAFEDAELPPPPPGTPQPEIFMVYNNQGAVGEGLVLDCTFNLAVDVGVNDLGIDVDQDGLAVEGCSFTVGDGDTAVDIGGGVGFGTLLLGCTFTGASGLGVDVSATSVSSIEGCTFDGLDTAILVDTGTPTLNIAGNTIQNCVEDVIDISVDADEVIISGNIIKDNVEDGILPTAAILLAAAAVDADDIFVLFNTFTGNTIHIDNGSGEVLDATNNWWGAATGPAEDTIVTPPDGVLTEPWLYGASSNGVAASGADELAGLATIDTGVDVVIVDAVGAPSAAGVISVASYAANPIPVDLPEGTAVAFKDVYVATPGNVTDTATIKLYGDVTADSEAWVWGEALGDWVICTNAVPNLFSGCMVITVGAATTPSLADLAGVPFAIVTGEAVPATVTVTAPAAGATDMPITNIPFTWVGDPDADSYRLVLSGNADLSAPIDEAPAVGTAYTYAGVLDYSTPYYYQVTAVSGLDILAESGVRAFLTEAEPVEPTPPVVIQPAPPAAELPDIILPPAQVVTPAWLYAVIAIAAVLVIAVIVLIVRTRRVS